MQDSWRPTGEPNHTNDTEGIKARHKTYRKQELTPNGAGDLTKTSEPDADRKVNVEKHGDSFTNNNHDHSLDKL